jgi:hypothetical protein
MNRNEALEKQIDEVMDWFDFAKVEKTMELLEWGWGTDMKVPCQGEIRESARKTMKQAARFGSSHSGGFSARVIESKDEDGPWLSVNLDFVVANWCADGLNYEPEDDEQ